MSERAPYSRVYWSVLSDDKFVDVRQDMRHFGSWTLLLVVADMAWPAPAYVPPVVPRASLRKLCEVGLIDSLPGGMYRVHGLDAERSRRGSAAKRDPNGTQLGPKREADGSLDKTSTSKDETSQGQAEARDPADIYWQLTGKWPSEKALSWIDSLTEQFGAEPTIKAMVDMHMADRSGQTLLGRTRDQLASAARKLDLKERQEEKQRLAEKRAQPRVEEAWRAEFRAAIEEQYRRSAA